MRATLAAVALLLPVPALAQDAASCEPADLAALADWNGVWISQGLLADVSGREELGGPPMTAFMNLNGMNAPWNDNGWAGAEEFMRDIRTASAQSNGWAFPAMMQSPAPLRFIISPAETVIVSQYRDIRYIPTDGQGLVPEDERWPTNWGTSAGCWEGNTLVIETASVHFDHEYNFITAHFSDEATFVERLWLAGPDRIEGTIRITDPATLTEIWEVALAYNRHPYLDRLVHEGVFSEGNRVVEVNGVGTITPPEDSAPTGPVFPAEIMLSAADLARYAGSYAIDGAPPGTVLVLEVRGSRLFASFPVEGRPTIAFPFYADGAGADSAGTFHSRALAPMVARFERDRAGNVLRFTGTSLDGVPFSGTRQP